MRDRNLEETILTPSLNDLFSQISILYRTDDSFWQVKCLEINACHAQLLHCNLYGRLMIQLRLKTLLFYLDTQPYRYTGWPQRSAFL